MDPNFDKMTGFSLPQPVEVAPTTPAPEVGNSVATPEKSLPQLTVAQSAATVSMPPVTTGVPQVNAALPQTASSSLTSTNTPAAADDNDLIEKEWVSRAKEIVEKTKEDPYIQSQELTKFKADYMLKRYNKELKISE